MKSAILDIYRSKSSVFTTNDIALIWKEANADLVRKKIFRYVKSGKLITLRKGIYAKDTDYNPFEAATKIYTPSYISLETVLAQEGVIFQHYSEIFVISYLTRQISCDDKHYTYKKIKDSVLMNTLGIKAENNYYIATKERAFLDAVYLYGNYYFDHPDSINWNQCFEMVGIYNNRQMKKRLDSYYRDYKNNS